MATSDIPDHSVKMGGAVTVDASSYFNDPDGDELSFSASSSNAEVASVAVEGSTATITGVAVGSAVVTVTASDGSASISQGFGVTVTEESSVRPATVTIFGLREVDDRSQAVDPSDVSGNISVLLDVQYNDETVTNVDLTLGDEVISCRGASSDAASPVGLAGAGAQVEIECFFDTDQVAGECTGMQLEPRFANGEHELGARITTSDGTTRDALASQMITLKNSNYVMIDHNPGSTSLVVSGVTYYGGPSSEENLNTFDVCPVAFDGTVVGAISLRGMTDTMTGDSGYGRSLSFLTHRAGRYGEYYGDPRTDREAPFTWQVLSSQNAHVEDRVADGHGGHWIIQDGPILDPDGIDISDKFVPGDPANELTKMMDPIYFDFASPRLGSGDAPSEVEIGGDPVVEGAYYSDVKSGRAQSVSVSNVTELGSGGSRGLTTQVIAVGDCSVSANTDTGRTGAGTAFVAVVDDANVVGDIPEDDAVAGQLSDDGGVDCYTAELQSLTDPLGNSRSMTTVRIQTAHHFGVDRGRPEIDDEEPDEVLSLRHGQMLSFAVEDPDLETGEAGSGVNSRGIIAYAGASYSRRVWDGSAEVEYDDGVVRVPTTVSRVRGGPAWEGRHTVRVLVPDNASPPNYASTSFTFVRDTTPPQFVVSASQSDIGFTNSPSVLASVGGVISDGSVIEKAELSLRTIASAGDACAAGDTLSQGRTGRVARNKRDLENDTNKIEFEESFTIRKPTGAGAGPERYCFLLEVEDSATESDGRGDGNMANYTVGEFSVQWPAGPPPPPPGPTFEFFTPPSGAAVALVAADSLGVGEGATTGNVYWVKLKDAPSAGYPLEMTIDASAVVTPTIGAGANDDGMFGSATDSVSVTVATAHDRNIVSELRPLTHKAKGFDDTDFPVRVMDDDFMISTDVKSIREDDDATEVLVTVTAGSAQASNNALTVTIGAPTAGPAVAADIASGSAATAAVTIAAGEMSDTVTVEIDAADDGEQDEVNEFIELSVSGSDAAAVYYAPAEVMILDDDPDIELSLSVTEVDEDAGNVDVTITATAKSEVRGQVVASIVIAGANEAQFAATTSTDAGDDARGTSPVGLVIDAGDRVGTATTTVTIIDDSADDDGETIQFSAVSVTVQGKAYTFKSVKLTIVDNDDSP